jgi:5-enolpyruvylshikimate-3-phosphate synthase
MKLQWSFGSCLRLLVLTAALASNGCIVDRIMDSEDRRHYLDYRAEAERINMEREKSGLAPRPILSYEQWKKQ